LLITSLSGIVKREFKSLKPTMARVYDALPGVNIKRRYE